jgi:hypothetical protein
MAMTEPIEAGALLSRTYELPAGPRVRLRYARRSDLPGLRRLLEARGIEASEMALARLVGYNPARRVAICASTHFGGTEIIVGVGAIDLHADAEPDTLVVDETLTEGLTDLLASALAGRARRAA